MKLSKLIIAAIGSAALMFGAAAPDALAQAKKKKTRCKQTGPIVNYEIGKGENIDHAINKSLTGKPGDMKQGLAVIVNRRMGNCIACHKTSKILALAKPDDIKSQAKYGFHGAIGPDLDGVASRYTEGELRLILANPKKAFPDSNTIMPGFHRPMEGLTRVIGDCKDQAVIPAQAVEDVLAYIMTLKE